MRKTYTAFEVDHENEYHVLARIPLAEAEPFVGEIFRVASAARYSGLKIRPQSTAEVVSYTMGDANEAWVMKLNYCPENPCDRDFMESISNGVA